MFCTGVPAPQHYYGGDFATYDEVRAFTASCRNNNNNNNTNYEYVRCDYNARIPDLFAGAPNAACVPAAAACALLFVCAS